MFITIEQQREYDDAMWAESQPHNAFATADQERHYLFSAGFTTYCDCSSCDGEREGQAAAAQEEADAEEHEAWLDNEATVEEIEALAAERFASSEYWAARDLAHLAADPWDAVPF